MSPKTLKLNTADNVAIALEPLTAGEGGACENIPRSHKIAVTDIAQGAHVLRYGQVIGAATCFIATGSHVHEHNMNMSSHDVDYAFASAAQPLPAPDHDRTFQGYKREDGRVGTRNYIGVLTSVNCSGSVARFIAEAAEKSGLLDDFPNVDGIVPIVHSSGCGMANHLRPMMTNAQIPASGVSLNHAPNVAS